MAIDPSTQYSGQVEAPDSDYPYGGAKNETSVDALDGTPYEKAGLNDIFGFQQALLSQAGIVPSGDSETAPVSQYLQALYQFMGEAKNFAINGTGVVQQRDDYTLVKDVYGQGPDMFAGMATGTAVSAGTLTQTAAANIGNTGFAHKFNQVTITGTGILRHSTRIESKDAKNFKNLKAALSVQVYHNVGIAVDYTLTVRKADAEDDFSSVTDVSNDGGTSVDSATATELKFEDISMGDCSNGIEIELKIESGAITLKDFEQTEYDFKVGEAATPFKPELIKDITDACQRHYLDSGIIQNKKVDATLLARCSGAYIFPTTMRDIPDIAVHSSFDDAIDRVTAYNATSTNITVTVNDLAASEKAITQHFTTANVADTSLRWVYKLDAGLY